jgi:hypothetical protein
MLKSRLKIVFIKEDGSIVLNWSKTPREEQELKGLRSNNILLL